MKSLIPFEYVERHIYLVRGYRVMLDSHLAELYGEKPRRLRQQVHRNLKRFPADFMFRLTADEAKALVSQNATPSKKHFGGHLPYVFTQEGVAMLSGVLRSERAVEVNIAIMRAFVKLREMVSAHKDLADKLAELEGRVNTHDADIKNLFDAIREWLAPPEKPPPRIGFRP